MSPCTVTFESLCELEPRLTDLLHKAQSYHDSVPAEQPFCANQVFHKRFGVKQQLLPLVGFERRTGPEELRTCEAYDIAYDAIYEQLPACRGCWCF